MRLQTLRVSGFQCFGAAPTTTDLADVTCLLGPNGAGKTALLVGLSRMFGADPGQRQVQQSDFHVPVDESPTAATARDLWVEADFIFPELLEEGEHPTIPTHFNQMRLANSDPMAVPTVRMRLDATLDLDGEIHQELSYVLATDPDGEPTSTAAVGRYQRRDIVLHYIPAQRRPTEQVSSAAGSLLGRLLRATLWEAEREPAHDLGGQLSALLGKNPAIAAVGKQIEKDWQALHRGAHYKNPTISFFASELEGLLKQVTVSFSPAPASPTLDFSRLSDGQQSLLYLSLILAMRSIGSRALAGELTGFDIDRLRPPVFTMLAVEEPENSLAPHLTGRVLRVLQEAASLPDTQVLVATHAPGLVGRLEPEAIRFLRLNEQHEAFISRVKMPDEHDEAAKFVRQALHAFPELYFARLVVLGEGDSEMVVLPKVLATQDVELDPASVSVVPLGGRHVNHFWRLLDGLQIPYVTLLDLDNGRFQGGWGRLKYAGEQLLANLPKGCKLTQDHLDAMPGWNSDTSVLVGDGGEWLKFFENWGVFFSKPLDLDFSMLLSHGAAYGLETAELEEPDEARIQSVLGKKGSANQYTDEERKHFDAYYDRFKLGSKPTQHLAALAALPHDVLSASLPAELSQLATFVVGRLSTLPE